MYFFPENALTVFGFINLKLKYEILWCKKVSYKYTLIEIQFTDDLITFKFTLHALLNICKSVTSMVIFFFNFVIYYVMNLNLDQRMDKENRNSSEIITDFYHL